MLLLCFNEYFGTQPEYCNPIQVRLVSLVTHLTLPDALRKVKQFEEDYEKRGAFFKQYQLLSVSAIEDLPDDVLNDLQMGLIEHLHARLG